MSPLDPSPRTVPPRTATPPLVVAPLTVSELADVVGGRLADVPDPDAVVGGPVVIDSRGVRPGALFVALRGENVDGHDYARQAVDAGAVAVLAGRPVGVPAVLVDDVLLALGRLARHHLDALPQVKVVAVTGSSGKTSTKDLLAQLLAVRGPLVAPAGNYNNEIGVPLTVLQTDEDTVTLVQEMGARGLGDIRYLTQIAPPHVAVLLNVGTAHVGEFGDRETIARAKGEIVEGLGAEDYAVLNADDPLVRQAAERTKGRVLMFGESVHADLRADDVTVDHRGHASFRLVAPDGEADIRLRLVGEHHVSNALAAAAVGHALGMAVGELATGLSAAEPLSRWRMEVTERPDGVTVVNDAYNANPESMRAALKALVAMSGGRRSWAVLGEMAELGAASVREHDLLGRLVVRLDVDRLLAVGGQPARVVHLGATQEGSWGNESTYVEDVEAALALLREQLAPGDVVLVKGSRVAGLERVADALLADQPAAGGAL